MTDEQQFLQTISNFNKNNCNSHLLLQKIDIKNLILLEPQLFNQYLDYMLHRIKYIISFSCQDIPNYIMSDNISDSLSDMMTSLKSIHQVCLDNHHYVEVDENIMNRMLFVFRKITEKINSASKAVNFIWLSRDKIHQYKNEILNAKRLWRNQQSKNTPFFYQEQFSYILSEGYSQPIGSLRTLLDFSKHIDFSLWIITYHNLLKQYIHYLYEPIVQALNIDNEEDMMFYIVNGIPNEDNLNNLLSILNHIKSCYKINNINSNIHEKDLDSILNGIEEVLDELNNAYGVNKTQATNIINQFKTELKQIIET